MLTCDPITRDSKIPADCLLEAELAAGTLRIWRDDIRRKVIAARGQTRLVVTLASVYVKVVAQIVAAIAY